ncbi:cobaltochelatase subunit CobN [Paenibacillus sp. GYB003]|uniref:cobaltochelatase subunit CobN n=1 Tax=Paenibacillus sp. GYB003 TaxID=2994392 RepID=UPI002F966734
MNITVLTSGETAQTHLAEAYRRLTDEQRSELRLVVIDLGDRRASSVPIEQIGRMAAEADLILFDAHGVRKETVAAVSAIVRNGPAHTVPIGGDSSDIRSLLRLGTLTAGDLPARPIPRADMSVPPDKRDDYRRYALMNDYWRGGGAANMLGLLCLAGKAYGGCANLPEPADPVCVRELCVFDPASRTAFSSPDEYRASRGYDGGRPTVALLFLGNGNPDTADCIGRIRDRIEPFAEALPIAFPSVMNVPLDRLRELLSGEKGKASLIVNFLPFRLGIGPSGETSANAATMLQAFEAPMLHPFFMSGTTEDEWAGSVRGLSPSQLLVQVALPEMDGGIETVPVAALRREGDDAGLGVALNRLALIPERAERLVRRIRRWLELQRKPNRDKKLALVGYNYPPGESNVFGGSFLDTFASVSRLLTWLKERGYDVEELSAEELRTQFAGGGLVNSGQWTGESASAGMIRYADPGFAGKLRGKAWGEEAVSRWGEPPGDVMTDEGAFLIPGLMNKNVFIGLQPSRGIHEHPERTVHDRSLLPTHQYTAFYEWIRDELGADAVVHIGTHGTLEFQRGKECGMSGDCVPDELIGDLPHIYFYYVGNPSEAMIAKRRSRAVLIGYQAPPFAEAELYGEWIDLETLLHEYREAEQLDPGRCEDVKRKLRETAEALQVRAETPERLEEELYRMKRSLIPSGLHVLGDGYSPEEAAAHMRFVLRHERGEARSLRGLLAERRGWNADAPGKGVRADALAELDLEAEALVRAYIETRRLPAAYADDDPALQAELLRALAYGYKAYASSMANEEKENFLLALEGKYVPAKLAGDAIRTPDVLPSGRNLVQFDPRAVPSRTAAERGAAVAEQSIRQYREAHGDYPNTTAVVLWGIETSRTQGETIGQILHYLGVRVGGGSGTFRTEYEIVPLNELGRPRLNVAVHMTGLFRDMFPNVLDDLNRLFRRVSELDEPDELNRFKACSRKTAEELLAMGYAPEKAADLASARMFGPAEGEYGTTVARLVETKHWSEEAELGRAYADSQHYVYSLNERGRAEPELFRLHLQAVDIVSQIRSSHEREVTDSDHYYEYFGGLSKSVELAKGRSVDIHIADTTGERVATEPVERAIARGVRTRLTNPKWIDALLEHPYHGAQQIARRFEYVLGLAATTGKVDEWVFDRLHDVYVVDESRRRQMTANNRWAYRDLVETLLESGQRGYWRPDEQVLERLRQTFLQLEGDLERTTAGETGRAANAAH